VQGQKWAADNNATLSSVRGSAHKKLTGEKMSGKSKKIGPTVVAKKSSLVLL
jgi:hypothetical protein